MLCSSKCDETAFSKPYKLPHVFLSFSSANHLLLLPVLRTNILEHYRPLQDLPKCEPLTFSPFSLPHARVPQHRKQRSSGFRRPETVRTWAHRGTSTSATSPTSRIANISYGLRRASPPFKEGLSSPLARTLAGIAPCTKTKSVKATRSDIESQIKTGTCKSNSACCEYGSLTIHSDVRCPGYSDLQDSDAHSIRCYKN